MKPSVKMFSRLGTRVRAFSVKMALVAETTIDIKTKDRVSGSNKLL